MIPLSLLTGYHCSSDSSQGGATVVLSKPGLAVLLGVQSQSLSVSTPTLNTQKDSIPVKLFILSCAFFCFTPSHFIQI